MPRVVVGVDGSQGSRTALRWALDEADSRKAAMDVVLVFTYSTGAAAWGLADAAYEPLVSFEDARTAAEHRLDDTLKALPDDRKVEVHPHVVEGFPAEELVQASANADLLVVGTRGAGGFRGLLLGSVSQQCVHHMACPVVVVPDR